MYKSRLHSLYPDMTVFERDPDMPVRLLLFTRKLFGESSNKTLAHDLNTHIASYLILKDRSKIVTEFFPGKLLGEAFDTSRLSKTS